MDPSPPDVCKIVKIPWLDQLMVYNKVSYKEV